MEAERRFKAGPGRRLVARIIDGLVLFVPVLVLTVPIDGGFHVGTDNTTAKSFVAACVAVGVSFVYFVVLEATRGATFGKSAMGLDVISTEAASPSSNRPTLLQSAYRNSFMLLSVVPGTVGGLLAFAAAIAIAITIGVDPYGRGLHDRAAHVRVEKDG